MPPSAFSNSRFVGRGSLFADHPHGPYDHLPSISLIDGDRLGHQTFGGHILQASSNEPEIEYAPESDKSFLATCLKMPCGGQSVSISKRCSEIMQQR